MAKKISEKLNNEMRGYEDITDLCRVIMTEVKGSNNNIDWEDVLYTMRSYSSTYGGFNIFPEKIEDYNGFLILYQHILDASIGDAPMIQRNCRDCGEPFFMYKSEVEFFESKNLPLPKRCKGCREKRKMIHPGLVKAVG